MTKSYFIILIHLKRELLGSLFIVASPNFLRFFGVKISNNTQNVSKTEYFFYFDCTIEQRRNDAPL